MLNHDELMINLFISTEKKLSNNYFKFIKRIHKNKYLNIKSYLEKRYEDLEGGKTIYKESIYRIYRKIEKRTKCPICGKLTAFNVNKLSLYNDHCSVSCEMKNNKVRNKINEKSLKLYGSINNSTKAKLTSLERYGVSNPAKSNIIKNKTKETNLQKYGTISPLLNDKIKEKTKQTNLVKYGYEFAQSNENIKEKIKKSNIDTCRKKYGVSNIMKVKEFQKKQINTFIKKYGVTNIVYSDKYKNDIENIVEKRYETKRKNHTFNTSKSENESYKLLKDKYPDVKYQYKSEKYPFACDFYIPSLDLYIECNYHWTHGGHPFNENCLEDQEKLKLWKSKNTKFYNNAINTWTIRDVNKRNKAKENKLNYIEFWNINELEKYIQTKKDES